MQTNGKKIPNRAVITPRFQPLSEEKSCYSSMVEEQNSLWISAIAPPSKKSFFYLDETEESLPISHLLNSLFLFNMERIDSLKLPLLKTINTITYLFQTQERIHKNTLKKILSLLCSDLAHSGFENHEIENLQLDKVLNSFAYYSQHRNNNRYNLWYNGKNLFGLLNYTDSIENKIIPFLEPFLPLFNYKSSSFMWSNEELELTETEETFDDFVKVEVQPDSCIDFSSNEYFLLSPETQNELEEIFTKTEQGMMVKEFVCQSFDTEWHDLITDSFAYNLFKKFLVYLTRTDKNEGLLYFITKKVYSIKALFKRYLHINQMLVEENELNHNFHKDMHSFFWRNINEIFEYFFNPDSLFNPRVGNRNTVYLKLWDKQNPFPFSYLFSASDLDIESGIFDRLDKISDNKIMLLKHVSRFKRNFPEREIIRLVVFAENFSKRHILFSCSDSLLAFAMSQTNGNLFEYLLYSEDLIDILFFDNPFVQFLLTSQPSFVPHFLSLNYANKSHFLKLIRNPHVRYCMVKNPEFALSATMSR